jgi:soluble lytic murein transglycosylase-like protein
MRGKRRKIAAVLGDALAARPGATRPAAAAAFAEALGWPLSREVQLRALTRDGHLLAVARSEEWAAQVRALAPLIVARVNERLGPGAAADVDVRLGPLER